jgi:hypothetical protein
MHRAADTSYAGELLPGRGHFASCVFSPVTVPYGTAIRTLGNGVACFISLAQALQFHGHWRLFVQCSNLASIYDGAFECVYCHLFFGYVPSDPGIALTWPNNDDVDNNNNNTVPFPFI